MKQISRYLLFYVIIGIGLALSWTQLGKRMQLAPTSSLHIMGVEENCMPYSSPCAAYAEEFALVLGPELNNLRLQVEKLPLEAEFELQQFDLGGTELEAPTMLRIGATSYALRTFSTQGRLRINLLIGEQQWVAEFPLQ